MYIKPEIKSYSTEDIIEALGPCQNQYSATLYTTTGNSAVNVDGDITSGGTVDPDIGVFVGDEFPPPDFYYRGFFGFDISSLTGRTIVSATLRLYQDTVSGAPYTDLGNVIVDHVNFGSSLDASDFSAGALTSNIGTVSSNSTLEWKTLSVTSYVQADLDAGRTSSQFRVRFSPTEFNNDTGDDQITFEDAENSGDSGNRAQLVITYN